MCCALCRMQSLHIANDEKAEKQLSAVLSSRGTQFTFYEMESSVPLCTHVCRQAHEGPSNELNCTLKCTDAMATITTFTHSISIRGKSVGARGKPHSQCVFEFTGDSYFDCDCTVICGCKGFWHLIRVMLYNTTLLTCMRVCVRLSSAHLTKFEIECLQLRLAATASATAKRNSSFSGAQAHHE